jgi:hypothetical protein
VCVLKDYTRAQEQSFSLFSYIGGSESDIEGEMMASVAERKSRSERERNHDARPPQKRDLAEEIEKCHPRVTFTGNVRTWGWILPRRNPTQINRADE